MKGAQHLAKRSSVDDSGSVPASERVPSTPTEAQVLSVCITYYYTEEIFQVRINSKDWSATLGPAVSICFLRWVPHMCRDRQRKQDSRGQQNAKGQKAALLLPWTRWSAQISCKKTIYPSNYQVSVFFWAFLFWRFFLFVCFKSYIAVRVYIKCQT